MSDTHSQNASTDSQQPQAVLGTRDVLLRCLQAALHAHKKTVSLTDLQVTAPMPRQPALSDLVPILKRLNFSAKITEFYLQELPSLPTPFILCSEDKAMCVTVMDVGAQSVSIYNPQTGEIEKIAPEALPAEMAEVLLIKASIGEKETWQQILLKRVRGVMTQVVIASILINLFALGAPLISMIIFNKVIGHQAISTLNVLAIGAITLYVFDAILRSARGYISTHTGARMDAHIGNEVMAHLLRLPLKHFEKTPSGIITERLRQLDTIRSFLTGQMPMLLVDLAFSIILFAAVFLVDVRMGFIVVLSAPIFLAISFFFDHAQRKFSQQNFNAVAYKTSTVNEMTSNALTVKSLGLESEMEQRHGDMLAQTAWTGYQAHNINNHIQNLSTVLLSVISLFVLYIGARFIMEGTMTIGELIAANMLVARTLTPIRQVTVAWHSLRETQHAFHRLDAIMGEDPEPGIDATASYPKVRGSIVLDNIIFSYAKDLPPVIKGVSLNLPSGSITGLVGASGCGKSTLGKIMLGVYKPTDGRVLIGDFDISQMSPLSLRRDIGYVPQENQLFTGTVRENILLGVADPTPAKAIMAAQFAGAHDFIQQLPSGYETRLTERGGGLSSGQRQMICIARALAREPRILIFDEATSALDLISEERLLVTLRRAAKSVGITVVFITHRVGTLRLCDSVVLMNNGKVEQQGSPEQIFQLLLPSAAPQPPGTDANQPQAPT
jgi:ABC-type bacteriocin/lantibiotic exporter with double-glycine peptidase domain